MSVPIKKVQSQLLLGKGNSLKKVSPAKTARQEYLAKLQIAKEVLKKMGNKQNLLDEVNKQHRKHSKTKTKKTRVKKVNSYSGCGGLDTLNGLTAAQAENINQLLREKNQLIQARERLKFYATNIVETRQAYFVEEVEQANMVIEFMEKKLEQKSKSSQKEFNKIQKKINKLRQKSKSQRKLKTKNKSKSPKSKKKF